MATRPNRGASATIVRCCLAPDCPARQSERSSSIPCRVVSATLRSAELCPSYLLSPDSISPRAKKRR